jgi:hypothetical protein
VGIQTIIAVLISALIKPQRKSVYSTQRIQNLLTGAALTLPFISASVTQVFYSHFSINVENTSNWLGTSQFQKNQRIY